MSDNSFKSLDDLADAVLRAGRVRRGDSPAAVVVKQSLAPVEGRNAIFFPPTYAKPDAKSGGDIRSPYNISVLEDGTKVAAIDSVGSHANRLEPLFGSPGYEGLVPKIVIEVFEPPSVESARPMRRSIPLLDVGHRLGDALVRGTEAADEVLAAFQAAALGDVVKVAALSPTSVLFGVWDSRSTRVKFKRLLSGRIDAYDVSEVRRSAQYIAPVEYKEIGLDMDKTVEGAFDKEATDENATPGNLSRGGYASVPSVGVHGGIIARGDVRRTLVLNLVALGHVGKSGTLDPNVLSRYLIGLGLVAMTAPVDLDLRSGCLLVHEGPATVEVVLQDGRRIAQAIEHDEAVTWAKEAAKAFQKSLPADHQWDRTWNLDRDKLSKQVRAALYPEEAKKAADKAKTENKAKTGKEQPAEAAEADPA